MKRIALSVFLGLVAGQAQASPQARRVSGSELLEYCSGPESGFRDGVCGGYVTGVHDLHSDVVEAKVAKPLFCMPLGVKNGQLRLVVKKWLQEHPEKLHLPASGLVVGAFREAFPCK